MSPMQFITTILATCFLLSSCSLYRSPDKKNFESASSSFSTQNLTFESCSYTSAKNQASASQLVNIMTVGTENDSVFLWEHKVGDQSVFETDNLKGIYCLYENN